ncbi:hypothetical protein GGQ84_001984 [Desulfitispora alkaliphila]|uniref:DUF192 domain-containing protein n=1 Tax=Desulfitispora alkaliphila TaxID=622674 RepID=UPI003D1E2E3F
MGCKVINVTKNKTLGWNFERADSFFTRLKGLIGRTELPTGSGLIIKPCNSIHTFFMKFPIDVIFLDEKGRALKLQEKVTPRKVILPVKNATCVLEMPTGCINNTNTVVGDQLIIKELSKEPS